MIARHVAHVGVVSAALVLGAGGGIACLNSVFKEKEQNSFDFQRLTRLTPLELALGKLPSRMAQVLRKR